MRIFCGLTRIDDGVAAALINERGGVIATAEVSDDPHGYIDLCRMWVRHSDAICVTVCDDGSTEALLALAQAGGQLTAQTPPSGSDHGFDAAVRIGRLVAFGDIVGESAPGSLPQQAGRLVKSMHTMVLGRHSTQIGLIELLRQCHPATLRAWPDPTCTTALELLRVLPDPADTAGDATPAVVAERLRGYADTDEHGELVDALMAEASDSHPSPDLALADAISAAADAVLACDRANDALADSINEQLHPRRKPAPIPAQKAPPRHEPIPQPKQPQPQPQQMAPIQEAPAEPPLASRKANPTLASALSRRPRGTGSQEPPATMYSPPLMRETTQEPVEPSTAELPPVASHSEPMTPTRGFPQMPEPPAFLENEDLFTPPIAQEPLPFDDPLDGSDIPSELETADDDLLIFSQARSAWFKGPAAIDEAEDDWSSPADEGWRTAADVATKVDEPEDTTGSGLPRRVPQANLVPGSAILADATSAPIKRDASMLAAHTSGYFRGWSRARRETVGAGIGSE